MNSSELGKLIKEARISKKMTQSEVVGNFITRNMLSQIENGLATPSIRTLQYLAGILDLHINIEDISSQSNSDGSADVYDNRLASSDNTISSLEIEMLNRLSLYKKLFYEGCYDKVADGLNMLNISEDSLLYDEYCALLAISNYKYAEELANNGRTDEAITHADKSSEFASLGIYANNDIRAKAILLSHRQVAMLE